jgi:hypothetical protein
LLVAIFDDLQRNKTPTNMKSIRIALLLLLIGSSLVTLCQQNPKFVYCEIVGQAKFMSTKLNIVVDFGEKLSIWADNRMKDENGKPITFNTMIDALNFMGKRGWQFSQAYAISYGNSGSVYHYLMMKPFDELDDEAKKEFQKN